MATGNKALKILNNLINQLSSDTRDKHRTNLTSLPDVQVLSNRVICILGQNPGKYTLQGTNTYLVGAGKRRLLIDAGQGEASYIPILKQAMKSNTVESIQAIICTHHHRDHINGIPSVLKEFGSRIPIYKYKSVDKDDKLPFKFNPIKDRQIFECDGATLIAHHTPGHCDDHIVLELKEENAIFSGDCILGEGSAVFDDLYLYMLSLNKLLTFDCESMYPGHGPKINDAKQRITHYIQHRNNREMQIINALIQNTHGMNADSICDIVYHETPANLRHAALGNLRHHLHKLVKERRVLQDNQGRYSFVK